MEDAVFDSSAKFSLKARQSRSRGLADKLSLPESVEAPLVFCRVRYRQRSNFGSGEVRERTGRKAREMIFIRRFRVDGLGTLPMIARGRARIDRRLRGTWGYGDLEFAVQVELADQ